MAIDRRAFVGGVAGAAAATLLRVPRSSLGRERTVRILDLEEHCAFPESIAGYEAAVASRPSLQRDVLILPAVLRTPESALRLIENQVKAGAFVIVESGTVFSAEDSAELREHRDTLHCLGIDIIAPVSLWPAPRVPYIDISWPISVKVRDFSRVVPVRAAQGRIFARVNGLPCGLVRLIGRGALAYLGWPLGVALRAGDVEAQRWLRAVLTARREDWKTLIVDGRTGCPGTQPAACVLGD